MAGDRPPWPQPPPQQASAAAPAHGRTGGQEPAAPYQASIVKNTFVELVDSHPQSMRRSASDSDVSRSSGEEKNKFWLPSLSSKSSQSSSSKNRDFAFHERGGIPLETWQSCALGRPQGLAASASSGGVASEAFGLPTLCQLAGAAGSGPSAAAADWFRGAPGLQVSDNGIRRIPHVPGHASEPLQAGLRARGTLQGGAPPLSSKGVPPPWPASQARGVAPLLLNHDAQGFDVVESIWSEAPSLPSSQVPAPGRELAALAPSASSAASGEPLAVRIQHETGLPLADLEELERQGVLALIPRNDRGEISSVGSVRHYQGGCSPCLFWFRKSCAKGIYCDYCHIRHKGQRNKRIRPSKKTRMQMRARDQPHAGDSADEGSGSDGDAELQGDAGNDDAAMPVFDGGESFLAPPPSSSPF